MSTQFVNPDSSGSQRGWLVVTAGVGTESFREAAERVARYARKLPGVKDAIAVTNINLSEVCPQTTKVFKDYQNRRSSGYGFMAYKSEIVSRGLEGFWGDFEGVVWIDAGCEICINALSNFRFSLFKQIAIKRGVTAFTLETAEFRFTKQELFSEFPSVPKDDARAQIQTTFFFLAGTVGKRIASKWLATTLKSLSYSNEEQSPGGELPDFVSHRHDQSIFSIVCKSEGITPIKYVPATGAHSKLGRFRALSHPIWVSRNRTGDSILPKFFQ